jgi:hypothetical protein
MNESMNRLTCPISAIFAWLLSVRPNGYRQFLAMCLASSGEFPRENPPPNKPSRPYLLQVLVFKLHQQHEQVQLSRVQTATTITDGGRIVIHIRSE